MQCPPRVPGVTTRSMSAAGKVSGQRLRERSPRRSLPKRTAKTKNIGFVYNNLNTEGREIRLCTLQPGALDDPLACTLTTVSLNDDQEYETLSYAWGDSTLNKEVLANGSVINITTNLHTALRYLRRSDRPRVLWADGICINQRNIDERAFQVSIMGDVYRKGRELQIWLGEAEEMWVDDSPELVSEMQKLCRKAREVQVHLSEVGAVLPNAGREDWAIFSSDISMQAEMLRKWIKTVAKVLESLRNVTRDYQLSEMEQLDQILDRLFELDVLEESEVVYGHLVEGFKQRARNGDFMRRDLTSSTAIGASKGPNIPGAFNILKLLVANCHLDQMPFFNFTPNLEFRMCPNWRIALRTLLTILDRPWWKRVWIVQEVALSHLGTVHIGRHEVPLSMFMIAVHVLNRHSIRCCSHLVSLWHGKDNLGVPLAKSYIRVESLKTTICDLQIGNLLPRHIFTISRSREATEPRDHVYAFRGLSSKHNQSARPDYQISISLLYASSTREIISSEKSIFILRVAVGVNGINPFRLPSWTCDWSRDIGHWTHYNYDACKGMNYMAISDMEACLTIEGFEIGAISSVSPGTEENNDLGNDLGAFMALIEGWWDMVKSITHPNRHLLWAILMLGYFPVPDGEREISRADFPVLDEWWDRLKTVGQQENIWGIGKSSHGDSLGGQLRHLHTKIIRQARRSTFYMTSQGHTGMGPRTLQQGDRIFVVKGSDMPLILRPHDKTATNGSNSEQQRGYQFVGVCYLYGIMHGEAVNPDTEWQQLQLY